MAARSVSDSRSLGGRRGVGARAKEWLADLLVARCCHYGHGHVQIVRGEVVGGGVRGGGALCWRVRGAVRHRGDGLMRCGVAWMLVVWVRWLLERLGEVEHRGVI